MTAKLRWLSPYSLAAAAAVIALAGAAYSGWSARRVFFDPPSLLSRFPAEQAAVLGADVAAMRSAGLLGSWQMALEPEYKAFLEATGFDYRRDIDQLTASFSGSGNYFIARGRFDWKRLRAYAISQGGACEGGFCQVQGSLPTRRISFLSLRDDAIALAVSRDPLAARRLTHPGQRVVSSIPEAPVWLSLPGAALRQPGLLPPLLRVMLGALTSADRIVLTLHPSADLPNGALEARLDTTCRSVDDARVLSSQLRVAAASLRSAKDDDLARALGSGSFAQADRVVTGRWPLTKDALNALTGGI